MMRFYQYAALFMLTLGVAAAHEVSSKAPKEHYFNVAPGLTLRVVKVASAASSAKNVIIFLPGRASFFEKNQDFVNVLAGQVPHITQEQQPPIANPFVQLDADVWSVDYPGHGKSEGRLAHNDQRCHIEDFESYLTALEVILKQHIMPLYESSQPHYSLIGASLGGHLAVRYVQEYTHPFKQVILVAPMLDFKTDPWPKWVAKLIVKGACLFGLGERYAIGYGDMNLEKQAFNREKSHHNRQAFDETLALLKANPELITSGPTNRWVAAAFDSTDRVLDSKLLSKIAVPVIIFAAEDDCLVENQAMQVAQSQIAQCKYITIKGAWHNLIKESDTYRVEFLQHLATLLRPQAL